MTILKQKYDSNNENLFFFWGGSRGFENSFGHAKGFVEQFSSHKRLLIETSNDIIAGKGMAPY